VAPARFVAVIAAMVAPRCANAYDDTANHMGERESRHRGVRMQDHRRGMMRGRGRLAEQGFTGGS
jgi:hypothetical protein